MDRRLLTTPGRGSFCGSTAAAGAFVAFMAFFKIFCFTTHSKNSMLARTSNAINAINTKNRNEYAVKSRNCQAVPTILPEKAASR